LATLLTIGSLRFRQGIPPKLTFLPFAINFITIVSGIGLFAFNHANPDFGFLQRFPDYQAVAERLESGQLAVNSEGFAALPADLARTSLSGYVYAYEESGVTNIFFLDDAETFDGYSWGYLYRSDGSEPPSEDRQKRRNCYRWREINPPIRHWFFCEAHREIGFPGIYGFPDY
jgi:hypothetical protein